MNTATLQQHTHRFSDYLREQDERPSPRFLAGAAAAGLAMLVTFYAVIPESQAQAQRPLPAWEGSTLASQEPAPVLHNASYWSFGPRDDAAPAQPVAAAPTTQRAAAGESAPQIVKCTDSQGRIAYTDAGAPCPVVDDPQPPARAAAVVTTDVIVSSSDAAAGTEPAPRSE